VTEDIKSAARAVFDAFGKHPLDYDCPSQGLLYGALPAALRAAAYQLEDLYCESDLDDSDGVVFALRHLCLIADEIETL
jgi:hypothetical protein